MLSKLPKSKNTLENVRPEANREKTTMKLKPINFRTKQMKNVVYSKRLRPIPPGLGSRIWNLGRCLLESCWGLLGSKLGVVEV